MGVKRRLIDLAQILMIAGAAFAAGAAAAGDLDPLIAFLVICALIGGVVVLVRLFPRGSDGDAPQAADAPPARPSKRRGPRGRRAVTLPEPEPDPEPQLVAEEPEPEPDEPEPAPAVPAPPHPPPSAFPPSVPRYQRSQGTRVLVVDDDENIRRMVARILGRYEFEVESAPDAALALQLIKDVSPPQLLLTELVLPGMTGTGLRDRVANEAPDLAVVFMTSFAGAAKERYGLRPGIDSVVEKPFEAAELLAAVEEALTIQEEGI